MWGSLFGPTDGRAGAMACGVAVPATPLVICTTSVLLAAAEMLAAPLLKRFGCCERHWLSAGLDPRSSLPLPVRRCRVLRPTSLKVRLPLRTPRRRSLVKPTRNALRAMLSRLLS